MLLAESQEDLQRLLDVVVAESERKGLSINCKKTESMVISKKKEAPTCNLKVKTRSLNKFRHSITLAVPWQKTPGVYISEVKRRIALAKSAFSKLEKKILRNRTLGMETRLRVLHCYIYPVLMYGSEAWSITSDMRKRLESCEMWFLRRMMRIPWTDKLTNEEVLYKELEWRGSWYWRDKN